MIILEEAGNEEALKKVVKNEIPYQCVNEDGTLSFDENQD
jgi:hypothetical protein